MVFAPIINFHNNYLSLVSFPRCLINGNSASCSGIVNMSAMQKWPQFLSHHVHLLYAVILLSRVNYSPRAGLN